MTAVSGRVRVNRPYFFTDAGGDRVEFPAFGTGAADLEGNQLREFRMYVAARQIDGLPASAPVNTDPVTIAGDAEIGATLTATPGTWTGDPEPALTYQWQFSADDDEWENIASATGLTFEVTASEEDGYVRVVETATSALGTVAVESASIGPIVDPA